MSEKAVAVIVVMEDGVHISGEISIKEMIALAGMLLTNAEEEISGAAKSFCNVWNGFIDDGTVEASRLYTDEEMNKYKTTIASLQEALLAKGGQA